MATAVMAETVAGHVRYTYRLRVSSTALAKLEAEWARCRWVWNECVAVSRRVHALNKTAIEKITCGPAQLDKMLTGARQAMTWLREGSSVPQQQIIRDFATSRAKALKDTKAKLPVRQRAGMPRIKRKRDAAPSLNYTARGFRIKDGRLHLAGGIVLTVVWSRALPSAPSSVRVYRDSLGHWYCSFVVATETEPLPATGAVIGIDWGVKETATTTSDAHDLPHAEYGRTAEQKLARYQRMMARRRAPKNRPETAGYKKARRAAAKVSKKIARQRQDTCRKWAKRVVRDFDRLAVEDFRPRFLSKSTMARKAADAAIGATKAALVEMARKHGRTVHLVNPAHTTMDCAHCGARAKHRVPLSMRIHSCTACGAVSPRDKNSARVMLVRAGLNPAGADLVSAAPCQGSAKVSQESPLQGGEDVKAGPPGGRRRPRGRGCGGGSAG
ncbi:RNA-guided endonuclease InsQ/TnpB family protein [Streptomyces toxytricini]|uniref:RNA-guided endonuclease InsQ/TnpB family protein n=1 Tax=Streptomyces toxytricini TaxID=67369 RepID=UPI0034141B26